MITFVLCINSIGDCTVFSVHCRQALLPISTAE